MLKEVEFMPRSNLFLEKLKNEKSEIENQPKVFVPADKPTNMYLLEPQCYTELLQKNVQKQNKKEKEVNLKNVEAEHPKIVRDLDIQERVFPIKKRRAFVTLKDYKENFSTNPSVKS